MKLRRRQKRKRNQALDAVASVTKTWSEWQLGKRATEGAKKAKQLRPPSRLKRVLSLRWVKIGGAVAVTGGTAAVVARKLSSDAPEDYTGPPPSVAADAAVPAPDTPAPLSVAPDPATQERDTAPASGSSALRANRPEAPADTAGDSPELVADAAAGKPAAEADEPAAEAGKADEPAAEAGEPAADATEAPAPASAATTEPDDAADATADEPPARRSRFGTRSSAPSDEEATADAD